MNNRTYLGDVGGDWTASLVRVLHVPFEIHVEELKDEVELLIGVHNIEEPGRIRTGGMSNRTIVRGDHSGCEKRRQKRGWRRVWGDKKQA